MDVERATVLPGRDRSHYNYFRDYDPQTARYVDSDPIGPGGGINAISSTEAHEQHELFARETLRTASIGIVAFNARTWRIIAHVAEQLRTEGSKLPLLMKLRAKGFECCGGSRHGRRLAQVKRGI